MSEQDSNTGGFVAASFLALTFIAGGFWLFDRPLQTARAPSGGTMEIHESRLWEDPLNPIEMIERHIETSANNGRGPQEVFINAYTDGVKDLHDYLASSATPIGQYLTVLGVHVPKDGYSLTSELRRRIRYAVISGLSQTHIPENGHLLTILKASHPVRPEEEAAYLTYELFLPMMSEANFQDAESESDSSEKVPAKQSSLGPGSSLIPHDKHRVLVLWIPETILGENLLHNYANLLNQLEIEDLATINPVLIGPHDSNGLIDLYKELNQQRIEDRVRENMFKFEEARGLGANSNFITQLALQVDEYLASGLSEQHVENLVKCYGRVAKDRNLEAPIEQCLKNLNIEDSQSEWEEQFARDFLSMVTSASELPDPAAENEQARIAVLKHKISIISARATTAEADIARRIGETNRGKLVDQYHQVIEAVVDDQKLMSEVFYELQKREVDPEEAKIALIYESDTEYGHALQRYLVCDDNENSQSNNACFNPENITSYSYLRGIDGQLPSDDGGDNESVENSSQPSDLEALLATSQSTETPFGRHQLDYLRRMAKEISDEEFEIIGVLGTDIFDKLLVLQATFPGNENALFFTTDRYSYLHHSSQLDWTKNLIIASSEFKPATSELDLDGLEFDPSSQAQQCVNAGIPGQLNSRRTRTLVSPFRDSYQSSYFQATCFVLSQLANSMFEELKNEPEIQSIPTMTGYAKNLGVLRETAQQRLRPEPVLFEVSRNGPEHLDSSVPSDYRNLNLWEEVSSADVNYLLSWMLFLSPTLIVGFYSARKSIDEGHYSKLKCLSPYGTASLLALPLATFLIVFLMPITADGILMAILAAAVVWIISEAVGPLFIKRTTVSLAYTSGALLFSYTLFVFGILNTNPDRILIALSAAVLVTGAFALNRLRFFKVSSISYTYTLSTVICVLTLLFIPLTVFFEFLIRSGESIEFWSGTSQWPNTVIRLQAVALSVCFGLFTYHMWTSSNQTLGEKVSKNRDKIDDVSHDAVKDVWSVREWRKSSIEKAEVLRSASDGQRKEFIELWDEYLLMGGWDKRIRRVLIQTIVMAFVIVGTYQTTVSSVYLTRDSYPLADFLFGPAFTAIAAFVVLFMISLGNDVTYLASSFVKAIRKYPIKWSNLSPEDFGSALSVSVDEQYARKVCLLKLVEERSKDLLPLIIYPFILISLMILSRSAIFQGVSWTLGLILAYAALAAYLLYTAWQFNYESRKLRDTIHDELDEIRFLEEKSLAQEKERLFQLHRDSISDLQEALQRYELGNARKNYELKEALDEVDSLKSGTFVAWYRHPIFQSIALPTTGTSGVLIMQALFG